jgi:hypothetical protein
MIKKITELVKTLFKRDKNIRVIKKIDYEKITQTLEKGDILVVEDEGWGKNYKYSGMYVGGSFNSLYAYGVINVINKKIVVNELHSILLSKAANIKIIRMSSNNVIKRDLDLVTKRAKNTINKILNFEWEVHSKKISIEDIILFSYKRLINRKVVKFNKKTSLFRKTYSIEHFTDNASFKEVAFFTL